MSHPGVARVASMSTSAPPGGTVVPRRTKRTLALLVLSLAAPACGGDNGGTDPVEVVEDGTLRVRIATTGPVPDRDGYRLLVDGVDRGAVALRDSALFTLAAGPHAVALQGLQANCTGSGEGQRAVAPGDTTIVEIAVTCPGRELAYQVGSGASAEIWVGLADHPVRWRLTTNTAADSSPRWSPDGTRLVFTSDRDGTTDIYTMRADGSDVRRVTANADSESSPSYTADGARILFTAAAVAAGGTGTAVELFVVDTAPGAAPLRLTTSAASVTNRRPRISPDGSRIALWRNDAGYGHVYLVPATGGAPTRLTSSTNVSEYDPAWSPDGSQVAYATDVDDSPPGEIVRVNVDGTLPTVVRPSGVEGYLQHLDWAGGDGRMLLVEMETPFVGSARTLKVMPATGGSATLTSAGAEWAIAPAWRPLP